MPRGQKTCASCGKIVGPRTWQCPACGLGFTLRGIKKPDIDVTAKPARSKAAPSDRLWSLVELYDGDDELDVRKRYAMEGQTWQSKCGRYRIREQFTFMRVRLTDHFSKCVYLFRLDNARWNIVRPKGRFRTPLAAIRRMMKDSSGLKVKATTRLEKLQVRVAALQKQKSTLTI